MKSYESGDTRRAGDFVLITPFRELLSHGARRRASGNCHHLGLGQMVWPAQITRRTAKSSCCVLLLSIGKQRFHVLLTLEFHEHFLVISCLL
jgi:hypothetical protein